MSNNGGREGNAADWGRGHVRKRRGEEFFAVAARLGRQF